MRKFEYFRINSIEELKKAYYMFEDKWLYSLESEIKGFNSGSRYVIYGRIGMYLGNNIHISNYNEIKPPINNINNLNKLI